MSAPTARSLVDGAIHEEGAAGGHLIGVLGPELAEAPVSAARVKRFCDLLEDGNARYREDGEAPPALLPGWRAPAVRAERGEHVTSVLTDVELLLPVSTGEVVEYWDEVLRVSPTTVVGDRRGRFVTRRTAFVVDGKVVGTHREVTFHHR